MTLCTKVMFRSTYVQSGFEVSVAQMFSGPTMSRKRWMPSSARMVWPHDRFQPSVATLGVSMPTRSLRGGRSFAVTRIAQGRLLEPHETAPEALNGSDGLPVDE